MEELIKKLGIGFAKYIDKMDGKLRNAKKKRDMYNKIKYVMDNLARDRSIKCQPIPDIRECPMATVTSQVYDSVSSGADESRIYTIVGTDGVVIEVLGFDILQKIKIFVRHPNGKTSYEEHDPSMAMTLIEARAAHPLSAGMAKFISG